MATAFENEDSSVEFQLGNKQLFLLFLGLLVICAIFFFIGLRVGEDTAKARIPVEVGGSSQADSANGTMTEQTLDLQPLSKQKQATKEETKPVEQPVVQQQKPEVKQNNDIPRESNKQTTKEKTAEKQTNQKPNDTKATSPARTGIFVQVLSSTDRDKARSTRASVGGNVAVQIQNAKVKGKTYYRVLIGPFKTRDAASAYRQQILPKFKDAFLQIIR